MRIYEAHENRIVETRRPCNPLKLEHFGGLGDPLPENESA